MSKPKSEQREGHQQAAAAEKPGSPDKAAQISEHIGRELRAMFDDVVAELVPEKFQELLEELEQKQTKP